MVSKRMRLQTTTCQGQKNKGRGNTDTAFRTTVNLVKERNVLFKTKTRSNVQGHFINMDFTVLYPLQEEKTMPFPLLPPNIHGKLFVQSP